MSLITYDRLFIRDCVIYYRPRRKTEINPIISVAGQAVPDEWPALYDRA